MGNARTLLRLYLKSLQDERAYAEDDRSRYRRRADEATRRVEQIDATIAEVERELGTAGTPEVER